jgi:hypothetical protein
MKKILISEDQKVSKSLVDAVNKSHWLVPIPISGSSNIINQFLNKNDEANILFFDSEYKKYFSRHKKSDLYKVMKAYQIMLFDEEFTSCFASTDTITINEDLTNLIKSENITAQFVWNLSELLNKDKLKFGKLPTNVGMFINVELFFKNQGDFVHNTLLLHALTDEDKLLLTHNIDIWDPFDDKKPFVKKTFNKAKTVVTEYELIYLSNPDTYDEIESNDRNDEINEEPILDKPSDFLEEDENKSDKEIIDYVFSDIEKKDEVIPEEIVQDEVLQEKEEQKPVNKKSNNKKKSKK